MSLEEKFDALMRQHELMFGESIFPPNKRCSKCQGLGHAPSVCPNQETITLAEWEAVLKKETTKDPEEITKKEDEVQEKDGNTLEGIEIEVEEGEILTLDTHHAPKDKEDHSLLFIPFGEPSNLSPTPPPPKTLKPNFCQSISEPFLEASNSTLRAYEEMVQSMFKESPSSPIPISKGKVKKRVSMFKMDLFDWLILFQPNLIQKGKVIT